MVIALKGQRLGQIPQPMHSCSEMKASRDSGVTFKRRCQTTTGRARRNDFVGCMIIYIPRSTLNG